MNLMKMKMMTGTVMVMEGEGEGEDGSQGCFLLLGMKQSIEQVGCLN